jgi:hypothetical protein
VRRRAPQLAPGGPHLRGPPGLRASRVLPRPEPRHHRYDKDFNEIGRWLERAHAATAKTVGIRARTVDAAAGGDKAAQDAAMGEFRKAVQAEYDQPGGPLWRAAAAEIRNLLETRLSAKK